MKTTSSLLFLLSTTGLCIQPLWAQEGTEKQEEAGEQNNSSVIIVTAQKRSERLNDVPLSVSAASGETLARQSITAAEDLAKVAPGFVFTRSAYGQPIFSIRGIGFYEEAIGISPAVTAYVDQAPVPFPRMTEGVVFDLERVEILKGPQGTLFGMNSTGGAMNFVAATPTSTFTAGGELTFGRFAQAEAQAFVSGPITDTLRARVAARIEQRGDWQKSYTRAASLGARNFGVGRILLDWDPTPGARFALNLNGWYNRSDTLAKQFRGWSPINPSPTRYTDSIGYPDYEEQLRAYPLAPTNARAADWNPNKQFERDDSFYMASLNGEIDLGSFATLNSITSYSNLDVNSPTDNDGVSLPDHEQIVIGKLESFSQEVRLSGEAAAGRLTWVLGANYQHDSTKDLNLLTINGSNSGAGPFRYNTFGMQNDQVVDTYAGFGGLEFAITDTITVQGSVRYTDQKRDFLGCLRDAGDGLLADAFEFISFLRSGTSISIEPGSCVTLEADSTSSNFGKPVEIVKNSLDENNVSWRGGLSWSPTAETMLYANVSRGYKSGAFGTLPLVANSQSRPVNQESVLAYEVGFKTTELNNLQLTGALFHYAYEDKQLRGLIDLGPPFGRLPALASIPKSRVNGAELDLTWTPATGLTFTLGGTYIDSKVLLPDGADVTINDVPDPVGVTFNTTGSAFPNTPKWQGRFDGQYTFAISSDWSAFAGAGGTFRSGTRSFFGGDANYELPGYTLIDARLGFERDDGQLTIMLWGKNITNEIYRINSARVHDTISWAVGMPFTAGVTISTRFK